MAENYFNISSFIDDLVPEHIATEYPELIDFIKVYTLYLEHSNKSAFYLNQLDHQRDIDMIEEELLTELQSEIGVPIPRSFAASPRIFYRHLVEFYKSRGTPESIISFFKLIYDDNVEIYFPKEDMLIPSDGKWFDQKDSILADATKHTAAYTFTIASPTNIVAGADDSGFKLKMDGDIVYLDGVHQEFNTWAGGVYLDGDEWINYIKFDEELTVGQIVEVYKVGLFSTNDGFASDKKYIQDSFFYQKFSYVLRTGKSIDDWKNAFTRLVHPAGFIFFGEILIMVEMLDSMNNQQQPGYQKDGLPRNIFIDLIAANPAAINIITQDAIYGPTNLKYHDKVYASYTYRMDHGTFVEKELHYDNDVVTRIGFVDHFDNIKFKNFRPMKDYASITFEDIINKTIGATQLGCHITET